MKQLVGAGLVGFVVVAGAAAQGSPGLMKSQAASNVEMEVRTALQHYLEAMAKSDTAALKRLLAESFSGLHAIGTNYDRSGWIDLVAKGDFLFQKGDATALEDQLTIHGDAAAAHTALNRYALVAEKRDVCVQTRTVLAKLDGEWRVVSVQGSLIHDGPLLETSHAGLTGKYEIEGSPTYTVTEIGRTLFGQLSMHSKPSPIFEAADGGFEGPLGRWQFTFLKDDKGQVTALTFRIDGKQLWRARRIE